MGYYKHFKRKRNGRNQSCFELSIDNNKVLVPITIYKEALEKGLCHEDIVRRLKRNGYRGTKILKKMIIKVKDNIYKISDEDFEMMEEAGIDLQCLKWRLGNGWEFEDAVEIPLGVDRDDWLGISKLKPLHEKTKAEEIAEEKLRRNKPHLFKVPQKHPRGKYCSYLMENDIFPKKVVS